MLLMLTIRFFHFNFLLAKPMGANGEGETIDYPACASAAFASRVHLRKPSDYASGRVHSDHCMDGIPSQEHASHR